MRPSPHRLTPFLVAIAVTLGACGEPPVPPPGSEVLTEIEAGTPRAEVMERLPQGELAEGDTPRQLRGYRLEQYLVQGQSIEVVWIHRQGSGGEFTDARMDLTPVVFRDGALDGWGWSHFDQRAAEWSLTAPGGTSPS